MKNKLLSVLLIVMCGASCDSPDLTDDPNDLALTLYQDGSGCTNFEVYTWNASKSIFVVIKGTIPNLENGPGMLQYDLSSSTDITVGYDYYGEVDGDIYLSDFKYCSDYGPNPEATIRANAIEGAVELSFANIDPRPDEPWPYTFTITITLTDVHFNEGVEDYISSLTLSNVGVGWMPG